MLQWFLSKFSNNAVNRCAFLTVFAITSLSCQKIPPAERPPLTQNAPAATAESPIEGKSKTIDRIEWPDEPLDDTPAAVKFLSLIRAKNESLRAKVRIFNFTEQDLGQLSMELLCKDVDGRSIPCIKPWTTTRNIPARSHVTHVIGAHLPAESDTIEVKVIEAKFIDGRNWPEKN